jgi:hypothetical protein
MGKFLFNMLPANDLGLPTRSTRSRVYLHARLFR